MTPSTRDPLIARFKDILKAILKRTFLRPGRPIRVISGRLKGIRYESNDRTGLSPLIGIEPVAQDIFSAAISRGDTVYDIGAADGMYSVLFSILASPKGNVVSFEPVPENVLDIENLVRFNPSINIEIVRQAISDVSGTVTFDLGSNSKVGRIWEGPLGNDKINKLEVPVNSLDRLIEDGMPSPNFVKIDVEGFAEKVLKGFRYKFDDSRPFFLSLFTILAKTQPWASSSKIETMNCIEFRLNAIDQECH